MSVTAQLDELGLAWHEVTTASASVEVLGVVIGGATWTVRRKPRRAWRIRLGLQHQIARRRATGWHIRALVGHLVSYFQLARPALSVVRSLYNFFQYPDLQEMGVLPNECLDEMRVAQGLLFLAEADLSSPACNIAYVSDASMKGFALLETDVTSAEVFSITAHRDRNRFRVKEKFVERPHDGFQGTLASAASEADFWDSVLYVPRHRNRPGWRLTKVTEDGVAPPPHPDDFVDATRLGLVVAGAWKEANKMHEYEARGAMLGLTRSSRRVEHHGTVLLSASDNMSSMLAFKGRATSLDLLAHCRRAAARFLACGITWRVRHVEGERNPSDFMSRAADRGEVRPGQLIRGPRHRVVQPALWKVDGGVDKPAETDRGGGIEGARFSVCAFLGFRRTAAERGEGF